MCSVSSPPICYPLHPDPDLTNARVGSLTVQDCLKWHIRAAGFSFPLLLKRNRECLETSGTGHSALK